MLRLAVVPAGRRFQVRARVNDLDVTGAGAGLGMSPFDLLVPVNRLALEGTVPLARCRCGVYDCVGTDVTVGRDGGTVSWTWSGKAVPMPRAARFAAGAYDAEVARVAADRSWETAEETACRLVLTGLGALLPDGVVPTTTLHADGETFELVLEIPDRYQFLLRFPWNGDAERLAREVHDVLAGPPAGWPARWHAVPWDLRDRPPAIAGPRWERWES